jgi:hypothetical protein
LVAEVRQIRNFHLAACIEVAAAQSHIRVSGNDVSHDTQCISGRRFALIVRFCCRRE